MKHLKNLLLVLLMVPCLFACIKEDDEPNKPTVCKTEYPALKVNTFVKTAMTDIYLWSDKVDASIPFTKDTDPKEYFEQLRYKKKDKWSWITDDVVALQNSFAGKEKSFGYELAFGQFSGTENYFAIITYVYPNAPASDAGLKRGDLFVQLNGANITQKNYLDLIYGSSIEVTKGKLTESGIAPDTTVNLVSAELDLDPVLISKVIEQHGKKIGYLFYAQYIGTAKYLLSIDNALRKFQSAGVTDVVLDLRYNRGGALTAAKHLCSSLAPKNVVSNEDVLITFQWNKKYQEYFKDNNQQGNLEDHFDKNISLNLNLSKLYVLTGANTASASELTITALKPYMSEVVTIGATTHGKYCASITVTPDMYYKDELYYKSFKDWAIQPIVSKYANAKGVTDFEDGFEPTYQVKDNLLPALPLGDVQEPLLKKAIEVITGKPVVASKKQQLLPTFSYQIVDTRFSRFDKQKEVLHLDIKGDIK